jgi:hypothetical protein
MIVAVGKWGWMTWYKVNPRTQKPNNPIETPLRMAAEARHLIARPRTIRVIA